jgi:coenzyme PQQ biosynthesis protein PqqD
VISTATRPRLASKVRLRWDRRNERYILLYPERGMVLSPTAADIVRLCTGEHTVEIIVDRLAEKYSMTPRETLEGQVMDFLRAMADRGLMQGDV